MLGRYVLTYFSRKGYSIIEPPNTFRITQESLERLSDIVSNLDSNTVVINCIGSIPQRHQGKSENEYILVNCIFPHRLWEICKSKGAKCIQPTTDCVFSGTKGKYTEIDIHDEQNIYGRSKSLGEPAGATIIRTSIIGCEKQNKKSFIEFVLNSSGKTIQGWDTHYWNGITCLQWCKVVEQIIVKHMFWEGVRHVVSPRSVSKYELCVMVRDSFGITAEIEKISHFPCVDKTLSTIFPHISEDIPDLRQQLKELSEFKL